MNPIESLYIHFPFCRHLCNYCDFYKSLKENDQQVEDFNQYFTKMIEVHQSIIEDNAYAWSPLKTLYIGGGTPSLWGTSGAQTLKQILESPLRGLAKECEFTLEVNPGGWKKNELESWLDIGVNRISFGVQSYSDKFLSHLDRVHRLKEVNETLTILKEWKINFSVDLMLGLPFSEVDNRDIEKEIEEILKWDPPHFSVYILTTKNQYIHKQGLPSDEWIEEEYLKVARILKENGYLHYEVSNFAKPGFESQHNLRYWNSETVAALGPSATGLLVEKNLRYKWKNKSLELEREILTDEQMRIEQIYLKLRTNQGIKLLDFFSEKQTPQIQKLKKDWEKKGLLAPCDQHSLILNSQGYLLMDSMVNNLLRIE